MTGPKRGNVSAFSSSASFEGFEAADFDAYLPKKWTSNAYTLARRRAKDKLLRIAHVIESELAADLGALELHGSDEAPSVANGRSVEAQWAFFIRDAGTRAVLKPLLATTDLHGADLFDIALQHQHACVAIRLDQYGVSVGLEISGKARVDRENVARKLAQRDERAALVQLAAALPGGAAMGIGDCVRDGIALDDELVKSWSEPLRETAELFFAQAMIPREEELIAHESLIGTIVELVELVLPIYRFLAWSDDNDWSELRGKLRRTHEAKEEAKAASFKAGDRVTILAGLFSGRAGYLAEIDAKGKAKVMVGPVAISLELKDIKAL